MSTENPKNEDKESLLSDIIKASKIEQEEEKKNTEREWTEIPTTEPIDVHQKKKEALPPGTILKAVLSLFFTAVIFLAIGLAYIIFNPDEAQIFVRLFRIDIPNLISWLRSLVNSTFGILFIGISIVLFISIFKAIWTPREQKRKKTLTIIISILILILLLTVLSSWMFLVKKIWTTIWDGGLIGIYDNVLYWNEKSQSISELRETQDLIGPITLRFDIRGNARALKTNWGFSIDRYEIDFDGAKCTNWESKVTWSDPENEQNIICIFDTIKTYNIRWVYIGKDIQGIAKDIKIDINPIEISWLVNVEEQKNSLWKDIAILDASSLRLIGEPSWTYENGKKITLPSIFQELTDDPVFVRLKVDALQERIFMIQKKKDKLWNPEILVNPSITDAKNIIFTLSWLTIDYNSILKIDWIINDSIIICNGTNTTNCSYTFNKTGWMNIKAVLHLADKSKHIVTADFEIDTPIKVIRNAQVRSMNKLLETTYDQVWGNFIVKNVLPPEKLIFDARDVLLENRWYELKEVRWEFSDGKTKVEKMGLQADYTIANNSRYTIIWTYTFEKKIIWTDSDVRTIKESFIIDAEYRNLIPQMSIINQTSDYVPSSITVDASQSFSENNEIIKFIYNFGEGRMDTVGDAIQTYEYTTPGEKIITLTIIDNMGQQAQLKKVIVLKETPKIISFAPSISPWIIWLPIDFTITSGWTPIESYLWSFWDNTPTQRWDIVTHIFTKPGEYNITLTVTYTDWTQKQTTMKYSVIPWN